jgi:hypothetical protein
LGLSVHDNASELSILASRAHVRAVVYSISEGSHSTSTPQRMDQCRKADQRGLRKSSSLTNGIGRVRNKAPLKEYAKGGPRSFLLPNYVNAPILGTPVNRPT